MLLYIKRPRTSYLNFVLSLCFIINYIYYYFTASAIYKDGAKIEEVVKEDATEENIEAMIKKYI